ncbi:MAG: bifunctional diaminohydroxyphosphoribosylaminopyrimidine deaminase/5-amino-6-(5-phosphoribosylamino)uracil reductase RibD [Gammaproteobacteria bacterium]|nr:bifunctional diaminohydroxyphosphoribosylaminopyrimidine deaminase/5-amino-6-(5-phosphoribosylamino)uracil reductase RibD [Gammaproteobacteria bacterium]
MNPEQDRQWMSRALLLAENGLYTTDPNPRVGCIIVKDNECIAEGWHQWAGDKHAEIAAISHANSPIQGATVYVTLEPCSHVGKTPPCADALIKAGVSRVVVAMQDPNPQVAGSGLQRLRDVGIDVECGLLESQAEQLNKGFCKRMREKLPWIMSKIAVSLDGRTALQNGNSHWITGAEARHDVHQLRARSSAIVSGSGTVRVDNPKLTARLHGSESRKPVKQPLRVILDTSLTLDPAHQLFNDQGGVVLVTSNSDTNLHQPFLEHNVHIHVIDQDDNGLISLPAVFNYLAETGINEVMVEAGPTLNGQLLKQGLVDEWYVYQAPVILGDQGRGMFSLDMLNSVQQATRLKLVETRAIGNDQRFRLVPDPVRI